ncbi:MAG: putative prohead protease [Prokaryotic dsDNA virus sp.]|nr:MAG: putative prohead protease [Prokaryotic dsDNA virus sp.]|tara:strand:- start:9055 stop:9765 length:711 start_codon:yes stop_codon:yes gene_type:complete
MSNVIYKQGQISDIDENLGIVKGYGSVFGNKDSDNDVIEKGAYRRTIKNNGSRVKYLYQHDITKPIGKMKELYEDEKGLVFVAEVPKTTFGNEVLELMKYGVIDENSVGIMPVKKDYDEDGVRVIKEAKLYEISAVTIAANDEAKILEVKGEYDNIDYLTKRFDNLIKVIRKGSVSDDLGYLIEYELEVIKSLIARDNTHQSDEQLTRDNTHLEAKEDNTTSDSIINYMFNNLISK